MKILVYGAGVIGTLFADRLHRAGNDVAILARGRRLADLREHGVIVRDSRTGETTYSRIEVRKELRTDDQYDLIVVAVRKTQIETVIPALAANTPAKNLLFMVNTTEPYANWAEAVGKERLMVGFPGAGGTITGPILTYAFTPSWLQQTTIGEVDGSNSERLTEVASIFRAAEISTVTCGNMHAWQSTHVAMISPLGNAVLMAGCTHLLPMRDDVLRLTIDAVLENFTVLDALGIPVTPARLNVWYWLPKPMLVSALKKLCKTQMFHTVTGHVWADRDEMQQLANELGLLARRANLATPAADKLSSYIDPNPKSSVAA